MKRFHRWGVTRQCPQNGHLRGRYWEQNYRFKVKPSLVPATHSLPQQLLTRGRRWATFCSRGTRRPLCWWQATLLEQLPRLFPLRDGVKFPISQNRVAWSSPSTLSVVGKGFYGVHDQGDLSFGVSSVTMCQAGSPITWRTRVKRLMLFPMRTRGAGQVYACPFGPPHLWTACKRKNRDVWAAQPTHLTRATGRGHADGEEVSGARKRKSRNSWSHVSGPFKLTVSFISLIIPVCLRTTMWQVVASSEPRMEMEPV